MLTMPGKVKVKVLAGRNLPVMDRGSDTTDAFVEIKFGSITHKTDVCRKSLNPHWNNSEWYRFEVEDSELQDEPLQLRLMDHDTYSANDAIGKVVVSLAPLLAREPSPTPHRASHNGAVMSGWIPVFDTMHGIRGELHIIVKVELFSDFNKFRQSSCGVQFFHCPKIPCGYHVAAVHGFVEELVVNDDPEYQWIDKIRTPRASNEARQVAFIKLSNQVQRRVGLKASELGANAVVGYSQAFDLQGEAGVVARAAATAVTLVRALPPSHPTLATTSQADIHPAQHPQLQKYLKFLTGDYNSQTNLNNYFQSHQDQMYKMMSILEPNLSTDYLDDQDQSEEPYDDVAQDLANYSTEANLPKNCAGQSPTRDYPPIQILTPADASAVYNLLEQEDARFDKSIGALTRGIKQLRATSQNIIPKSLTNIRGKRLSNQMSDDQISLKSNSSDSSRLSLTELRAEFKKFKKFRRPKFRRSSSGLDQNGGSGMVSVLVRSVMQAHSSLDCITETQDSDSPSSTLRRGNESQPITNLSVNEPNLQPTIVVEEETKMMKSGNTPTSLDVTGGTSLFSSLGNVCLSSQEPLKSVPRTSESCPSSPVTLSNNENLLKLPGDVGYFGSISSALSADSSEAYSTSEDEVSESSSFPRTDTEKSLDTISAVVKSVLESGPDAAFIAHMEERLELSKSRNRTPSESRGNTDNYKMESEKIAPDSQSFEVVPDQKYNIEKEYGKTRDYHSDQEDNATSSTGSKFSNTFTKTSTNQKSISVPSSPVQRKASFISRSSISIKKQLSKLLKTKIKKSFSHNALPESIQVKFESKPKALSSNVLYSGTFNTCSHNSACKMSILGSPFMSYADLLSLNREHNVESPTSFYAKYFEENLPKRAGMFIGSEPSSRMSLSGPSSPSYARSNDATPQDSLSFQFKVESGKPEKSTGPNTVTSTSATNKKPCGLIQTAMETILIDRINALMVPTTDCHEHGTDSKTRFLSDVNRKLCDYEKNKNESNQRRDSDQSDRSTYRKLMRQDSIRSETSIHSAVLDTDIQVSELRNSLKILQNNALELPSATPISSGNSQKLIHVLTTIPSLPENPSFDASDINLPVYSSKNINQCDEGEHADMETKKITVDSEPDSHPKLSSKISADSNEVTCIEPSATLENIEASTTVCNNSHAVCCVPSNRSERSASPRQHGRTESVGAAANHTPVAVVTPPSTGAGVAASAPIGMNRRSSDSDLSITPKGGSLTMTGGAILRPSMNPNNLEMLEYPFLTMDEFPPGFVIHIGGTVCARSVKLVERSEGAGGGEAAWWAELRTELRAHARALRCTAVLGYSEAATICEDVCILSASGTAAVINLEPASFVPLNTINGGTTLGAQKCTMTRADSESEHCSSASHKETQQTSHTQSNADTDQNADGQGHADIDRHTDAYTAVEDKPGCSIAHVPYNHQSMPYQADVTKCCVCRRSRVPRILICTVELPAGLVTTGRGCLITAAAARIRRAPPTGEPAARDLSDQLPFLEYELHRLLVAKLRVLGMNALFGLRVNVSAGERLVVALASGTAVLCDALPAPRAPRLVGQADAIAELQRALDQALATNRSVYELEPTTSTLNSDDSDDDLPNMELTGDKDACVLEVDDAEDIEMARTLASGRAPRGVHAVSVRRAPHMASSGAPHAFTQLWRARVSPAVAPGGHAACVARHVHRLMQSVYYKLRRLTPCVVCDIKFQLDLPEVDEIQLLVTGVALPLPTEPPAVLAPTAPIRAHRTPHNGAGDELVFTLEDEDEADRNKLQQEDNPQALQTVHRACGVAVTPLERVCGSRSQRHVSALRLLFVRETTSVRELGGISGFLHTFVMEVLAVARAYSTALGGNALSSFYITELMLQDNPHKNQGQCLLSVGGDVVFVTY